MKLVSCCLVSIFICLYENHCLPVCRMIRKQRTSWLRRGRRSFLNSSVRLKRHGFASSSWRWSQSSSEMKPGISHAGSSEQKSFSLFDVVCLFVSDEKLRKTACVKRKKRLVGRSSNRSTCAGSRKSFWRSRASPNHAHETGGHDLNHCIELNLPVRLVRNCTFNASIRNAFDSEPVTPLFLSPAVSLCSAPSGSSLSLASAATEGDSVASGGASSHR